MVDGKEIAEPTRVKHGARIRFGNSVYFTFVDPEQDPEDITCYEHAATEASAAEVERTLGSQAKALR